MKFNSSEEKITESEFDKFLTKWNVKVPDSYRTIILEYNGGYPELKYFRGFSLRFLPIGYLELDVQDLLEVYQSGVGYENVRDLFPFCDSSGTTFAFVCRGEDLGKVYWIDETGERSLVCNSFDEFMDELSDSDVD